MPEERQATSSGHPLELNIPIRFDQLRSTCRRLRSGVDSDIILFLDTSPPSVLKVGPTDILTLEARLFADVRAALGARSPFPRIYQAGEIADRSFYLMEAGTPETADQDVFDDVATGHLRPTWEATIREVIETIEDLYVSTKIGCRCINSQYHSTLRIDYILSRDDFRATAYTVGGVRHLEEVLARRVVVNGRELFGSFLDMNRAVVQANRQRRSTHSAVIHGDLHLKNIIHTSAGGRYLLLDPRVQWDGQPIDRFGYGDPLYDIATLVHSVGCMAPILEKIARAQTRGLASARLDDDRLHIELDERLFSLFDDVSVVLPRIAGELLDGSYFSSGWQTRMWAYAANALLGWLKYGDAVCTREAWWAIFACSALSLDRSTENL